jgi:UDP-3-O-[3-hydroxymyristoyl] N-acetylglucosamine deacetylase
MKQKTIKNECSIKGIGIHSGKENYLRFLPSDKGCIEFRLHNKTIEVSAKNLSKQHSRATVLETSETKIITPEHLLSACAGLGIDNLIIECSEQEIPILDGSAIDFIHCFLKAGIKELNQEKSTIKIHEPIIIQDNEKSILLLPSDTSTYSYYLHYPNHFIGTQLHSFIFTESAYINDIAPARTYGFEHEIQALLDKGLAKGGSLDNALIIGDTNYNSELRLEKECVKHKILDMIGDFWILNQYIKGHIIAIKSGHQLNAEAVKIISEKFNC